MTIEVRETKPDEYRRAADAMAIALLTAPPDDEAWDRALPSWDKMVSLSAWDGDRCVGHAGQFVVDTTVPGGARLSTGAVSRVGVLPTSRRQGVATALMTDLVRDADGRGLVLMSLRASEATIYERFGFGVAGDFAEAKVTSRRARPLRGTIADGSMRLVDPDDIIDTVAPIYERCLHRRVGMITRGPSAWRRYFRTAIDRSKASFVAVHTGAGGTDDGYVHYDVTWNEDANELASGLGEIHDLWAIDDATELALWRFVFDIDLVQEWKLVGRPVDDLLRAAVADRRGYRHTSIDDEQWLRLVDVDAALTARTYAPATGPVTIRVTDPLLPANDGTWQITADGATSIDIAEDADLETDIAGLSAAYLGGTSWHELTGIGMVTERTDGAIEHADALFRVTPTPFCGSFF